MTRSFSFAPTAVAVVALTLSAAAWAKVPAGEADRLGKDLTCVGAEKAGNKDGTIPEYSGKWLGTPPGIQYTPNEGMHPVDPYKDDKPLFTITAQNLGQYESKLSDGQKAMFKKFPQTFRIPVYPGRRDFRYPDFVCQHSKTNALNAEISDGGLGIAKGVKGGVVFPIPKTGDELLMNHIFPYRAFEDVITRDAGNVLSNGTVSWGRQYNRSAGQNNNPRVAGQPLEGIQANNIGFTLLPEREKGGMTLSQEPINFAKAKRLAWSYDPGTRRVRQLPEFGFDQPLGGTGGKMTIDSDRLFNGSPERYTWKLIGKQEMYIPANTYKLHANTVKYADLVKPGHANPDYMRYELRRVWVLEGTLKEGFRHLYGKRVLHIDEDTWQAVMSDYYDARGQLWQWGVLNYYYAFDMSAWQAGTSFYHDLNSGGYVAYNLFQEREKGPILNKGMLKPEIFTPEALRGQAN